MEKFLILFSMLLSLSLGSSCSKHKNSATTTSASTTAESRSESSGPVKPTVRKLTRPDPVQAAKKAGDALVADIITTKRSVEMYDNLYKIFGIMYDNRDNCDLALEKVKAFADKHRKEMLATQKDLEVDDRSMSEKDRKRYVDWKQRRDLQLVNDSMKLMIDFNYRCKKQMMEINAQIASLSSK